MNADDCRTEPDWTRDDDLRADIYDDDHGTGRDWTPPHGIERPYKSDFECPQCDGLGRYRVHLDEFIADHDQWAPCRRCKGTGHK